MYAYRLFTILLQCSLRFYAQNKGSLAESKKCAHLSNIFYLNGNLGNYHYSWVT